MVGKGRRRREKNYKAAHGGPARLPPPPDPSQVEAVPSKLRKIMSLTSASNQGSMKISKENEAKRKRADPDSEKRRRTAREIKVEAKELEDDGGNGVPAPSRQTDGEAEIEQSSQNEKRRKKKKRKRKQVTDLRFQEEILGTGSKRRERKKKYFEAKKKKHKKAKTEDNMDFPGREQVKFGEVVEAPPKLVAVPKAFKMKTAQDASKERLRLQAIEAYRNRKGWTSRPGAVELPPPVTS